MNPNPLAPFSLLDYILRKGGVKKGGFPQVRTGDLSHHKTLSNNTFVQVL